MIERHCCACRQAGRPVSALACWTRHNGTCQTHGSFKNYENYAHKTPSITCAHNSICRDKSSCVYLSSPYSKNISVPFRRKSPAYPPPSCPTEGRLEIVTDAGQDAVDAACQKTNDVARGRRSRVVLTPRRWRQTGERDFAGDGGKKARSPRRARRKPLKPLRRECRVFRRDRGD